MDTGLEQHSRTSPVVRELDNGKVAVTLSFHDPEADNVWVAGGPSGVDPVDRLMRRARDGWWEREYELPRDVRTLYWFARTPTPSGGDLMADPLNPRTHLYARDPDDPDDEDLVASVLELADAAPLRWSLRDDTVPCGDVAEHLLASERLGNERRVYLYTPPAYNAARAYPLVVCFDGYAFQHDAYVPLPTVLDNLIAAGAIRPVVAVLPDSLDHETRMRELVLHEPFVDFVAEELLPWASDRLSFTDDPAQTLVTGSSAGGLAATFCALRRPDRFGLVLSLSGSVQFGLADEFVRSDRLPLRFYLDAGVFETVPYRALAPTVHANRHLRDVLVAKGYDVTYREFPGAHDYIWWRETVADGLIALLDR